MNFPRIAALAALAAFVSACSNSSQSLPATVNGTATGASVAGLNAGSKDEWHRALRENGLPAAGCFKAVFPSTTWARIACGVPPKIWFPPRRGKHQLGQQIGDGQDYTADVTPKLISQSIGSFPATKDVQTVTSQGGSAGPNSYTLQLNSNFFTSAACGTLSSCAGWSQFVYSNPPGSSEGALFIQDWLVPLTGRGWSQCPPGKGWENVGFGCVQNSPGGVYIPNVKISDIANVTETGVAATDGDSVYMSVDGTEYGMKNVQSDGITDLSTGWQGSEFNIIGNGGGGRANFNSGAKITVNIQVDDGATTAPSCPAGSGTTGETNNL
ncbi:MAG TPA: hypothetical protein VGF18_03530, partial [Candidatus Tumulicola sp.]